MATDYTHFHGRISEIRGMAQNPVDVGIHLCGAQLPDRCLVPEKVDRPPPSLLHLVRAAQIGPLPRRVNHSRWWNIWRHMAAVPAEETARSQVDFRFSAENPFPSKFRTSICLPGTVIANLLLQTEANVRAGSLCAAFPCQPLWPGFHASRSRKDSDTVNRHVLLFVNTVTYL
jgi:hypothetical protein